LYKDQRDIKKTTLNKVSSNSRTADRQLNKLQYILRTEKGGAEKMTNESCMWIIKFFKQFSCGRAKRLQHRNKIGPLI
jgi:hypothetical protein